MRDFKIAVIPGDGIGKEDLAHYMMVGEAPAQRMIPYFWSDQYGKKIQVLGHPHPRDDVEMVSGGVEEAKWVGVYSRDGVVTGVVSLSHPRALMLSKVLLDATTTIDEALQSAPWAN